MIRLWCVNNVLNLPGKCIGDTGGCSGHDCGGGDGGDDNDDGNGDEPEDGETCEPDLSSEFGLCE